MPISSDLINRRSVYPEFFTGTPIDASTLESMFWVGAHAPNHGLTYPWRFRVFHSEESRKKLSVELANAYQRMAGEAFKPPIYDRLKARPLQCAAVAAVVCAYSGKVAEWEETAAVAMAVLNIQLSGLDNGIGMYWGTPAVKDHLGDVLALDKNEQCLGFLFMGHFSADYQAPDKSIPPLEQFVQWV